MGSRKQTIKTCDKSLDLGIEENMINKLPDHLICQILIHLPTKEAVLTSVLSTKWRNLWKWIPGLDIKSENFEDVNVLRSFVDMFFDFNRESCISKLRLCIYGSCHVNDTSFYTTWIDAATKRKIQHLDLYFVYTSAVEMPLSLYTCMTLVTLQLSNVTLVNAEFVSLSCLKIMHLKCNHYPNDASLEKLISCSPVLEDLAVIRVPTDNVKVLQVRSRTVKRVDIYHFLVHYYEKYEVIIDAPLLEVLKIKDCLIENIKIINHGSTNKVDIDVSSGMLNIMDENVLYKRNMTRKFFSSISKVRHLVISNDTTKVIYQYKNLEPQLQFRYLSQLNATFSSSDIIKLPMILKSCPKLESLILVMTSELVDRTKKNKESTMMFSLVPICLVSSLKFVDLKSPILGYEREIKLVTYLLKNSAILEKLSLRIGNNHGRKANHVILQDLLAIPRCSSACEVVLF